MRRRGRAARNRRAPSSGERNPLTGEEVLHVGTSPSYKEKYVPVFVNRTFHSCLFRFKSSDNFRRNLPDLKTQTARIPLIDRQGYLSENVLALWKCNPYDFFASTVSTTFKRLWASYRKRMNGWDGSTRKRHACTIGVNLWFKCAVIVCIDRRIETFRRLVNCSYSSKRGFVHLMNKYKKKMDEPSRFLYSHAIRFAEWLQHRGKPRARAIRFFHRPDDLSRVISNPWQEIGPQIASKILQWMEEFSFHGRIPRLDLIAMRQASSQKDHPFLRGPVLNK